MVKWEKDQELLKERSRIEEQSRKDLAAQKRQRQSQSRRDKANRNAEKTKIQRLIAEADKQQALRATEAQREAEAIRVTEERREERLVAIRTNWTRMMQKAEQRAQLSRQENNAMATVSCIHSSTGFLKSEDKGQCDKCQKVCGQYSYKCPDCGSMVCTQCQ